MYSRLHKLAPKTAWITWVSEGVQRGFTWVSKRDQKTLFLDGEKGLRRSLSVGVFFLLHFVGLGCLFCHIATWVREATVLGVCS